MWRAANTVIASEAKQSILVRKEWIASSRSLSSGARSRDPVARRNGEQNERPEEHHEQ
jgi:hypothetical protein